MCCLASREPVLRLYRRTGNASPNRETYIATRMSETIGCESVA
jgi:hypothetical protein